MRKKETCDGKAREFGCFKQILFILDIEHQPKEKKLRENNNLYAKTSLLFIIIFAQKPDIKI